MVAVSYFFTDEAAARQMRHGVALHAPMYVAGAVVVVEMSTGKIKWNAPLDLSTDETKLRAYIYSAPTVVDLEADGEMEVRIVSAGVGEGYHLRRGLWEATGGDCAR